MYAITATLAYGITVSLERLWMLWIRWKLNVDSIRTLIQAGKTDEAASQADPHPVAQMIRSGANAKSSDSAWNAMGTAAPLVEDQIRSRVASLATVGNIATMLGLLGTVYGLIYALQGLEQATAVERTTRLSVGIAAAMTTTAWGLLTGIPALAMHSFFSAKVRSMLAICESLAAEIALQKDT